MNSVNESAKVLSLGSILGGRTPTNRGWVDGINQLMRQISSARDGVTSNIKVTVEFHIPGNLIAPDYEGVRTGYFRKADSLIKVQVALPPEAPNDARPVLVGYLWAALDAVDAWAVAKNRNFDTLALRELVAAVESANG
ncbi:hypothetical protein AB4Y95_14340 [Arthrobacter sp. M-10]|uniref:hypothetical protein n=1 Tax=Arthrobacter sp. M-10 TaxID=3233037 RepID=UPI003F921559